MKNSLLIDIQDKDREWVPAIYKDRWVTISLRYNDFFKFVYQFMIPFSEKVIELNFASSFYYNLGQVSDEIIQLNFKTSQYKFNNSLKPYLFDSLNEYFDHEFLSSYDIKKIDESIVEKKSGFEHFDWKSMKIIGIEEFSLNTFPFSKGRFAKDVLSDLLIKSSDLVLRNFKNTESEWTHQDSIEKSIAYLFPVLHTFMKDREEMYRFCFWVVSTMLNQVKEIPGYENIHEYKAGIKINMEQTFQDQKEILVGYSQYLLDILDDGSTFEDTSLNEWLQNVKKCKHSLDKLDSQGLLHILFDLKEYITDPTEIKLLSQLNDSTFRKWQIAYYILNSINGQLGLRFNFEYYLYYFIKRSLMIQLEEAGIDFDKEDLHKKIFYLLVWD